MRHPLVLLAAAAVTGGDNDGEDRSQRQFILRQPRLKISTLSSSNNGGGGSGGSGAGDSIDIPMGPFTFTSSSRLSFDSSAAGLLFKPFGGAAAVANGGSNGITTTACDICKVQTTSASQISKKFSAHNCEACRKFISKMLKKSSISATVTPLACVRGSDGGCDISGEKGKDRCNACLLKSCLRTYNLPLKFRLKLHLLLPQAMKIADKAQLDGFHKRIKSSTAAAATTVAATGTSGESNNLFTAAVHSTNNKILLEKDDAADEPSFKSISTKSVSLPNPLAENNLKFGSQPPIKPNLVIDKPIIMSPKVLKEAIENEQVSVVCLLS